jgi:hypothetical protein
MKKIVLVFLMTYVSLSAFSQNLAESANKPMNAAQKATIELVKIYDLTGEQALEVKKIQEAKFTALAKIEALKAQDFKKYVVKRLSAFETTNNSLMSILDERQMEIFKKQQIAKTAEYEGIVAGMKKQGYSQSDIDKKLAETEF